jgi:hypothetical protein
VSPVRYELGFISQKTTFFIVTAVNASSYSVQLELGNSWLFVSNVLRILRKAIMIIVF